MSLSIIAKDPRSLTLWTLLFAALSALVVCTWRYLPLTMDDALIAYRYSQRFLEGHGLTWNDGEFVEGYSDLLWVLLIAAGGLLHSDLVLVGKVLGVAANISTIASIVWAFGRSPNPSLLGTTSGVFVLALSTSFAVWGVTGLETAFFASLLAWALATTHRMSTGACGWVLPGTFLGLLSITRPDGILFAVSLSLSLFLRDGFKYQSFRTAMRLVTLPLLFATAQTCFRLAYYGALIPNTAHAKIAFTTERMRLGVQYVLDGMLINAVPLLILLALSILNWRFRRANANENPIIFVVPGLVWLTYIGLVGGDVFPFHRQWVPALICLAFAVSAVMTAFTTARASRLATWLIVAGLLHLAFQRTVEPWMSQLGAPKEAREELAALQRDDPDYAFNFNVRIISDCRTLGEFARSAFGSQQPLFAVIAAGCLPYSSRLPSLDMLGLNDSYIARHRPKDMGKGLIAHELGDGSYVLSRKPDLMAFCVPTGSAKPCYLSERQMVGMEDFRKYYRLVNYSTGSVNAAWWTRIEDGRLGIRRDAESIRIPGFLLATTPGVRAIIDSTGRTAALIEEGTAIIDAVYFPPGAWTLYLSANTPELRLEVTPDNASTSLSSAFVRIESTGSARSVRVHGEQGLIYEIIAIKDQDQVSLTPPP